MIWIKTLPVDFVVACDPGYATQGLCAMDCRREGPPSLHTLRVGCTDNSIDLYDRIMWQFRRIGALLADLGCPAVGPPANVLLVTEEFHNTGGKSSATATHHRGVYDGLFRDKVAPRFRFAVTQHPMHVRVFSTPHGNKKKDVAPTVFNGTPQGVLTYIKSLWPEIMPPGSEDLRQPFYANSLEYVGKKPSSGGSEGTSSKSHWAGHGTDAMVMSTFGLAAFVYPGMQAQYNDEQRAKAQEASEVYGLHASLAREYR